MGTDIEKYTKMTSNVLDSIDTSKGIISTIYRHHIAKYAVADQFLADKIIEKGMLDSKDMEIAARLYAIPKLRKEYVNISKIIIGSDLLCEHWNIDKDKAKTTFDDDWFNCFIEQAKTISNEEVQQIWSAILVHECFEESTFRKVMLDRLALLDRKSAVAFGKLCTLTYTVEVSDGRTYPIPLYLRDNILTSMIENGYVDYTSEFLVNYKTYVPDEDELEILQEIGLIHLSEGADEGDIYSSDKITFTLSVDNQIVNAPTQYDEEQKVYFLEVGNARFTRLGRDLYNCIKKQYPVHSSLLQLVTSYINNSASMYE